MTEFRELLENPEAAHTKALLIALEQAGLTVSVEPSAIAQSPFPYLYVYLSDDGPEGPYVLASDPAEIGPEEGYWVGFYENYEDDGGDAVETLEDVDAAVARVRALVAEHS